MRASASGKLGQLQRADCVTSCSASIGTAHLKLFEQSQHDNDNLFKSKNLPDSAARTFNPLQQKRRPLASLCELSSPDADESTSGCQELDNKRAVV